MSLIVAIDVDGPVANLDKAWIAAYNRDYQDDLQLEQVSSWAVHTHVKPECGTRIYEYLTEELYQRVEPVPGAREAVQRLRQEGYRVIFVTSTPKSSAGVKLSWLQQHGFLDEHGEYGDGRVHQDYVEAHDKSLIRCDIMVDDRAENLATLGARGVLWNAHHNQLAHGHYYARAACWPEVLAAIDQIAQSIYQAAAPHPTEKRCPQQVQEFRKVIDQMYSLHLSKNFDYSPANILGTGETGTGVRLWDKCARLLNLEGIDIILEAPEQSGVVDSERFIQAEKERLGPHLQILILERDYLRSLGFELNIQQLVRRGPKPPAHEGVEDTLLDLANYAIIALLLRRGVWGR